MFTSSFTDLNQKLADEMIEFLLNEDSNNFSQNVLKSQKHIVNAKNYYLSWILSQGIRVKMYMIY